MHCELIAESQLYLAPSVGIFKEAPLQRGHGHFGLPRGQQRITLQEFALVTGKQDEVEVLDADTGKLPQHTAVT